MPAYRIETHEAAVPLIAKLVHATIHKASLEATLQAASQKRNRSNLVDYASLRRQLSLAEEELADINRKLDALETEERKVCQIKVISRSARMDARKRPLSVQVVIQSPPGRDGKRGSVTRHLRLNGNAYVGRSLFGNRIVAYSIDDLDARVPAAA